MVWMEKTQPMGVQRLAGKTPGASVSRVSQNRMAQMDQMDAQLMRPPGLRKELEQSGILKSFHHPITSPRLSAGAVADSHLLALDRMPTDRGINRPFIVPQRSLDHRDIGSANLTRSKLAAQIPVSGILFGDDENSRGIFVQSMNDPRLGRAGR